MVEVAFFAHCVLSETAVVIWNGHLNKTFVMSFWVLRMPKMSPALKAAETVYVVIDCFLRLQQMLLKGLGEKWQFLIGNSDDQHNMFRILQLVHSLAMLLERMSLWKLCFCFRVIAKSALGAKRCSGKQLRIFTCTSFDSSVSRPFVHISNPSMAFGSGLPHTTTAESAKLNHVPPSMQPNTPLLGALLQMLRLRLGRRTLCCAIQLQSRGPPE